MLIFLFWIILLRKYEQIPKLKIKMGSFSNPDEKIKILGKRINAQKINLWFSFGKIRFNVFMKNVKPIKLKKEKNTAWTKYILFETIPIIALILIISLDSLKIVDLYDESQWFILIKYFWCKYSLFPSSPNSIEKKSLGFVKNDFVSIRLSSKYLKISELCLSL